MPPGRGVVAPAAAVECRRAAAGFFVPPQLLHFSVSRVGRVARAEGGGGRDLAAGPAPDITISRY